MQDWTYTKIKSIDSKSEEFPKLLKQINDCPKLLYFRGEWNPLLFERTLAVVGSRALSRYGSEVIERWMPDFVENKLTIVSGFMYGADTKAHVECLKNGGVTIAVLGSGLNQLTPIANFNLYSQIVRGRGLVISEYEPELKASKWTFPRRNRIVAALASIGILVVEAGLNSGSMITANLGNKMGKKVYAVPGLITSDLAKGTNFLIQSGQAKLVAEARDITQSEGCRQQVFSFMSVDSENEKILKLIDSSGVPADYLALKCGVPITKMLIVLSDMCLKGIIREDGGLYFPYR